MMVVPRESILQRKHSLFNLSKKRSFGKDHKYLYDLHDFIFKGQRKHTNWCQPCNRADNCPCMCNKKIRLFAANTCTYPQYCRCIGTIRGPPLLHPDTTLLLAKHNNEKKIDIHDLKTDHRKSVLGEDEGGRYLKRVNSGECIDEDIKSLFTDNEKSSEKFTIKTESEQLYANDDNDLSYKHFTNDKQRQRKTQNKVNKDKIRSGRKRKVRRSKTKSDGNLTSWSDYFAKQSNTSVSPRYDTNSTEQKGNDKNFGSGPDTDVILTNSDALSEHDANVVLSGGNKSGITTDNHGSELQPKNDATGRNHVDVNEDAVHKGVDLQRIQKVVSWDDVPIKTENESLFSDYNKPRYSGHFTNNAEGKQKIFKKRSTSIKHPTYSHTNQKMTEFQGVDTEKTPKMFKKQLSLVEKKYATKQFENTTQEQINHASRLNGKLKKDKLRHADDGIIRKCVVKGNKGFSSEKQSLIPIECINDSTTHKLNKNNFQSRNEHNYAAHYICTENSPTISLGRGVTENNRYISDMPIKRRQGSSTAYNGDRGVTGIGSTNKSKRKETTSLKIQNKSKNKILKGKKMIPEFGGNYASFSRASLPQNIQTYHQDIKKNKHTMEKIADSIKHGGKLPIDSRETNEVVSSDRRMVSRNSLPQNTQTYPYISKRDRNINKNKGYVSAQETKLHQDEWKNDKIGDKVKLLKPFMSRLLTNRFPVEGPVNKYGKQIVLMSNVAILAYMAYMFIL